MDWRIYANGTSAGEGWNAMDGDEDIAMALLMADKQWGSAGKWNYLQEAKNTIGALKSWNMKPDGTTKGLSTPNVSRTSDYMIGHFRAFQAATGDSFWSTAINRSYDLANQLTGGDSAAYHGPICAGACIDAKYQPFLDAMWNWNAAHPTTGYYDGEIQLLSMVVASGNWWTPSGSAAAARPDPADCTDRPDGRERADQRRLFQWPDGLEQLGQLAGGGWRPSGSSASSS